MIKNTVQVVAPFGRDGSLIASLLEKSGVQARVSSNLVAAFNEAERDLLGALLISEEALTPAAVAHLAELLSSQPGWSDLPVIVLTPGGEETEANRERQQLRLPLGHLSLLERPVRPSTLLSSVQAAIRARMRQFEIRDTIAQRNAASLKLQQSEERLRIATETAHIGTWELDLTTMELDSSNTCKENFGRAYNQSLTYPELQAAIHPEDRAGVLEAVEQAMTRSKLYRAEYRIFWPDGSLHWVLASGRVQYASDQKPLKITGVTLDVSERHLAMNALLQTEKLAAVGRLSAAIAHEINNPLESITNLLYLARSYAVNPSAKQYLELADRELRRVCNIATQTLRFHKQQSAARAVTPRELFEGVLSIQQGRLVNSSVTVEIQLRSDEPILCFDGEIRQVINNLIANAIDAMSVSGGRLLLRARMATEWKTGRLGMIMTVADTGSGIPSHHLKQIFDAFFTTKGIGGTGLGLWVTQEIVNRHSGKLQVKSRTTPQPSGSIFALFLPSQSAVG